MTMTKDSLRADIMSQFKDKGEASVTLYEGVVIKLTPCHGGAIPQEFGQLDYILTDGTCWMTWMHGEPEKLLDDILDWRSYRDQWNQSAARTKELYDYAVRNGLSIKCPEYDTYSDMHKEVFGYRPHGWNYNPLNNPV